MDSKKPEGQFYFFGVMDRIGHYFYPRWPGVRGCPWGDVHVDTLLCRKGEQTEGLARIHHKDGWTAVGYWDRTGDSRYFSNSNFVAEGTFTFEQMMEMARRHFPDVIRRAEGKFEIRLEE